MAGPRCDRQEWGNNAGLENLNIALLLHGWLWLIEVLQVKYLNNIIEQPFRGLKANPYRVTDHRFIKRITRQMKGFKCSGSDVI